MKKLITTLILLVSTCISYAQDKPGNNLGKSLSIMKREFPELRYLGSDATGDRYQDGYAEEGIGFYFLLKDDVVSEECIICDSDDGFSQMYFNEMWKTFSSKWPYAVKINKPYSKMFDFGTFKIIMSLDSESGINRASILYSR